LPEVSQDGFGNGTQAENDHEDANATGNAVPVVQVVPEALEGWVRPTAYDYTGEAPREWEGNAAVYEWDGETGDIGPEYPELELQLFGNPAERTASQGIDFSK
jgi:ATP-dependent RNA helicase DDX3X